MTPIPLIVTLFSVVALSSNPTVLSSSKPATASEFSVSSQRDDAQTMAILLNQTLRKAYQSHHATSHFHSLNHSSTHSFDVLSANVPGTGLIFQVRAPVLSMSSENSTHSAWESAQNSVTMFSDCASCHQSSQGISATSFTHNSHATLSPPLTLPRLEKHVLQVILENVQNIKNVEADDDFILTITFPDSIHHQQTAQNPHAESVPFLSQVPILNKQLGLSKQGRGHDETRGDLHLRQENYQEALNAYSKALELAQANEREPELRSKYLQAQIGAKQYKKALSYLRALSDEIESKAKGTKTGSEHPKQWIFKAKMGVLIEASQKSLSPNQLREHVLIQVN